MKLQIKVLVAALALATSAAYLVAQDTEQPQPPHQRPPGGPEGRRMGPPPPLFAALDANHDGVIDSSEIDNAPAALRKLDKNGDGQLTMDELRPPRGPGGPGGPGGEGHPPGPPHQEN